MKIVLCLFAALLFQTLAQPCRASPDAIRGLEPRGVWANFYAISCIPRCPTKEKQVREVILKPFAAQGGFSYKEDEKGNVLITVPPKRGREGAKTVVLQTHLDMVCEKNRGTVHDFDKDPIQLILDGKKEYIHGNGTTLGSDDGMGMAHVMAVVRDPSAIHGPLELLFTVEEEIGLQGASALKPGFLTGKTLINIDADREGEVIIGCAGGMNVRSKLPITWVTAPESLVKYQLKIAGGLGGHSGVDINKNRANVIKVLTRVVMDVSHANVFQVGAMEAGTATNAIPREAVVDIFLAQSVVEAFVARTTAFFSQIKAEFATSDPGLVMSFDRSTKNRKYIQNGLKLFNVLAVHPSGVHRMSPDIPNLVETSLNLASLRIEQSTLVILTSIRSSIQSGMDDVQRMLNILLTISGGTAETYGNYPGWKPDLSSKLLAQSKDLYKRLFGVELVVAAIHAGLETGVIGSKYPGMDMISYGSTTVALHSPDEKVLISSVPKTFQFTLKLIDELSKE